MPTATEKASLSSAPTALVAGGAGFLGSHLAATLISQNFKVLVVDNLSSGKKDNVKDLLTSENFTFIEADIANAKLVLPEGVNLNYIFHLASIEEAREQKNFSLDTLLVNSLGTRQLLELAREHQAKFVLGSAADLYSGAISSSSLRYYFGKTPGEEAILSSHEAKRFSEALAFEYFNKFKVDVTIVRLKDAYGPRMDLDRGDEVAKMIKQALSGDVIEIVGDGLKILHPTYVSDIIFNLIKAAVGDFNSEIFILVHPEKVTAETVAQTLKLVAGPLEIEHKKDRNQVDFSLDHFDLTNTKEKLGWNPKVALAEGLGATLQSFKISADKVLATTVAASPESVATEQKVIEPLPIPAAKKVKGKTGRWGKVLRAGIFFVSALLIIITLIYPTVSVEANSLVGTGQIEQSSQAFDKNQLVTTKAEALKAQNSFQTAAAALGNINWLIKIVGQSKREKALDQVLQASSALATAFRLRATAEQALQVSAEKVDLTPNEAKRSLNEILDNLAAAQDQLTIVKINLQNLVWSDLPPVKTPSEAFLEVEYQSLEKENQTLIQTIINNLPTSD